MKSRALAVLVLGMLAGLDLPQELRRDMKAAAANLDFERAAAIRDTLKALRSRERRERVGRAAARALVVIRRWPNLCDDGGFGT